MAGSFRFAVLGDCHFASPKYHAEDERNAEYRNYLWMIERVWPQMLAEIRAEQPAFLVQLGDFTEGPRDAALHAAEMCDAVEWLERGSGCPVWLVKGNHEREAAFREVVLPRMHSGLLALAGGKGRPLAAMHYAFSHAGARFIIVDSENLSPGSEQAAWLEAELKGASGRGARAFVFAHGPLFTVGRPFFSFKPMLDAALPLLDRYPVDAWFCGHTHNQAATLHRNVRHPLLQLKTTLIGYPLSPMVPLHQLRPSAVSSHSYDCFWGFLEDCAPSWYLVTIEEGRVRAEWRLLGRGAAGVLEWEKAGRVRCVCQPEMAPRMGLDASELEDVGAAWLYVSGYKCLDPAKTVRLNGEVIGTLPPLTSFEPRASIPVPPDKLGALALKNEVTVENPNGEKLLLGGFYIEVLLDDCRLARTTVSPELYATCGDWDSWNSPILKRVPSGEPIWVDGLDF
ncbi:MAG: metallophosphoesterase [Verrucomicrobia bacterium]|nr:metallophosphoesterase [Verrucomicrobiota bacterium]